MIESWKLPPERDATFTAAMEDVLAVYRRPVDPRRPLLCIDESGKELQRDVHPRQPATAHHPARIDPEYARAGSANLMVWTAPHLGLRGVKVAAQRTRVEWAQLMRHLVEEVFPDAERLVVVLDNLNIHTKGALYHTFPSDVANRIAEKLELHYTPLRGSWLNAAELELSRLKRACLSGRIGDVTTLQERVTAWADDQNARQRGITWQFNEATARTTLHRIYPIPVFDK